MLGIEANPSTAYHPQTNGQTERINMEIEQYLRVFVNYRQTDWPEWLPLATFSYNDKIHSSTGFSPFFLNKGEHPRKGTEPVFEVPNQTAADFVQKMKDIQEEATASIDIAQEQMKRYYDRTKGVSRNYQVGEKVWLEGLNIKTYRPSKKLEDKRYGPFKIKKKVGKSAYLLDLPATWKALHPVFNEAVLSPYIEPQYPSQTIPPPPPPVDAQNHIYNVEKILQVQKFGRKLKWYVKWEGYPLEKSSWEPIENLEGAETALEDFYRENPDALR